MADVRGLSAWMKLIGSQELPSLDTVVRAICDLSDDDDSCADDLTQIILRDADLTSQVLKIANSVHYNRSYAPIKTVSRAIVQIGWVDLKNIALATSLIDGFLGGKPKELLIQRLAMSFHAAVQARAIAHKLKSNDHEEVFIAALLRHVGELALLATGRPAAERFVMARDENPEDEHSLALEHLGVGINTLNKALIREWGLGDLVQQASEQPKNSGPLIQAVNLGSDVSLHLSKGLDHPEMVRIAQRISKMQNQSVPDVREQLLLMAEEASAVAATYGAERLLKALPDRTAIEQAGGEEIKTDHDFQRYINRLSQLMMREEELSKILQLGLQALYRGSGLPRVAISLIAVREKRLEPVYVAGEDARRWRKALTVDLNRLRKGESLHDFLRRQEPVWYQHNDKSAATGVLAGMSGEGDCVLAPQQSQDRLLGVLYADANGGRISARQYEECQLVANQLNMFLRFSDRKKTPSDQG